VFGGAVLRSWFFVQVSRLGGAPRGRDDSDGGPLDCRRLNEERENLRLPHPGVLK
jgi:hypothetical protein